MSHVESRKCTLQGIDSVEFLKGCIEAIPLAAHTIDVVVYPHHWYDWQAGHATSSIRPCSKAFPDIHCGINRMISSGDTVVLECTFTGHTRTI